MFDRNWQMSREQDADLVDEHYYNSQSWFLANAHRYDDYDRSGPHVFVGEYAARANPYDNTFYSALTEAAFMTGLERNSDVVEMASDRSAAGQRGLRRLVARRDLVRQRALLRHVRPTTSSGCSARTRGDTVVPTTLDAATSTPDAARHPGRHRRRDVEHAGRLRRREGDGQGRHGAALRRLLRRRRPVDAERTRGAARGTWSVVGGEYRQTANVTDARSVAGSPYWSNYTLELTLASSAAPRAS